MSGDISVHERPTARSASIVDLLGIDSLPGMLFCGIGVPMALIALAMCPPPGLTRPGGAVTMRVEPSNGGAGMVRRMARLNPEGRHRTVEEKEARKRERTARLRAMFAQGPWYAVAGERVTCSVGVTSHGPNYAFRRLALDCKLSDGTSVEVNTVVVDRRSTYLAVIRDIPGPDEHFADANPDDHATLTVEGQAVRFDVWNAADGRTVAAATVGDRAILVDAHSVDLSTVELERIRALDPFLA